MMMWKVRWIEMYELEMPHRHHHHQHHHHENDEDVRGGQNLAPLVNIKGTEYIVLGCSPRPVLTQTIVHLPASVNVNKHHPKQMDLHHSPPAHFRLGIDPHRQNHPIWRSSPSAVLSSGRACPRLQRSRLSHKPPLMNNQPTNCD